jgi:hypothetical protein
VATYGYDTYGHSTYGPSAPTGNYPGSQITVPVVNAAYVLPNIVAQAQDYASILVTWGPLPPGTIATVTEFRLLTSPWGFPVDQNDGNIVIDVTGSPPAPGGQYLDASATPGAVQYYGFYVLANGTWLRAGFTACLLPEYNGYDVKLMADLPPYFQNQSLGTVAADVPVAAPPLPASGGTVTNPYTNDVDVWLTQSANVMVNGTPLGQQTFFPLPALGTVTISYTGNLAWQWIQRAQQTKNTALPNFMSILGYGLDLVKSQYDLKFKSLNDPMTMSLGDLANFCAEIGLPYNTEIPAYLMRKAALFWGQVMQERGTLGGIAEHITLLTGYAADIQTSRNFMLDDDQANPADPMWSNWSSNVKYQIGELVQYPVAQAWSVVSSYAVGAVVSYNDLFYTCILAANGQPPTNATYWSQNVNGPYVYYCTAAITSLPGTAPSGSLSANGNWSAVYGGNENGSEATASINIPGLPSNAGTWEFTNSAGANYGEAIGIGFPIPQTWVQGAGTPQTGPNGYGNTFRALNNTGSTINFPYFRSVARSAADITAGKTVPDPQLVVQHAVPLPDSRGAWNSKTTYFTNDIVTFGNLNYIALRQSTGATPPVPGSVLNQNYDFETTISPWVSGSGGLTVTQSNAQAYYGTHSMLLTATSVTGSVHASSEFIPAIPGATYIATALVFSGTAGQNVSLSANWVDTFNGYISGIFPNTVLAANTWTAVSTVFTVPTNTSVIWLAPSMSGTGTWSGTSYWDLVELTCIATPEWAPLGADSRLPVTTSGYAIADLGFNPTVSTPVVPFVEWYDNWGNLITRVFARTATPGTAGYPTNYQYDSFNTGAGFPVSGRVPTNPNSVWSVPAGTWTISSNGIAYAGTTDADALGVVASPAQGTSAATVTNPAQAGDDCGPLFWYLNTSNFWVAGLSAMYYVASATTRIINYTGTAATGDRIYAEFNNTTSTTNTPNGNTVIGPSVIVYKNSRVQSNILVVVGSGGTATQTAMSSLTTPYLPSTGATTSNAGIASIAI